MTNDAPLSDDSNAADHPVTPEFAENPVGDPAAQPGVTPAGTADTGYELTGRDRFAVRLIDAAVKLGTEEFQARYRPVTEELFTHHFIDPTSKPSYVKPELKPITDLETTSDPLEIIRTHLDSVIEDRQVRDEARIGAETRLATVSGQLAETTATAADLNRRLTEQTARAEAAELEVSRLRNELQSEVAALHAQRETEVAALSTQRDAEVAALHTQRETEITSLHRQRETEVGTLAAQRDAEIAALREQRETELASLAAQRDAELSALHSQREAEIGELTERHASETAGLVAERDSELAALQSQRQNEVATLRTERDATIAGLHAQRETEVGALMNELSELRAQRDAHVAELNARLEAQMAELEGTRSSDVKALAEQHETELATVHTAHEQRVAELTAAHEQQVAGLISTHEQQVAELSSARDSAASEAEQDALASGSRHDAPGNDASLSVIQAELAQARAEAEAKSEELERTKAEFAALRAERDQSLAQRDAALEDRDGAVAESGEWENRLRMTVGALASIDEVGDWTEGNAPDERLVQFVSSTTRRLEAESQAAAAKLAKIEEIATEELVDESETNEYAIGANDAAVRVLNALDDADEE